jgi:DNA polymerase III subunit gamma/tau
MHELALYRKYRPQTFSEVRGQEHVVDVLADSVGAGKVSHAYLFIGSRGTGKTSVARIFAREIGVSQNDLHEIDAASNRGIEDIKELREGARVLPFDSKYKVYLIDEVHMLSKDAWGALLKILEEPPQHVIFILATTEFSKVPDTIISRCQVFTFKKPTEAILKESIAEIAKEEKYDLDSDAAELVAILGDGSFRDALGVLQKVLNFSKGKNVKREEVEKITGAPKATLVNSFLVALAEKDLEAGMTALKTAAGQNLDMKLFTKLIVEKMRGVLLARHAPKLMETMAGGFGESDLEFVKDLAKKDKDGILRSKTLASLLRAYQNIDRAFIPELPLELALLEILGEEA